MNQQYPVYVPLPTGGGRSDANYTETCRTEVNGDKVCKREYEDLGTAGTVVCIVIVAVLLALIGWMVYDTHRSRY